MGKYMKMVFAECSSCLFGYSSQNNSHLACLNFWDSSPFLSARPAYSLLTAAASAWRIAGTGNNWSGAGSVLRLFQYFSIALSLGVVTSSFG